MNGRPGCVDQTTDPDQGACHVDVPPFGPWVVHLACGATACDLDLDEARALLIELAAAIEDIEEIHARRCVCRAAGWRRLTPPQDRLIELEVLEYGRD